MQKEDTPVSESVNEIEPEPETKPEVSVGPELDPVTTEFVGRAIYDGPYTVEGFSVLNVNRVRVAIAGYDTTRAASGPGLARLIADSLNKAVLR